MATANPTTATPAATAGGAPIIGGERDSSGPGPEVMAADTLEGDRVVNPRGEQLGKIRKIMIDVRSGRVAYAVLAAGGVAGVGERLHAIPWSALVLDADNKCFVLDVSKERLLSAPGFDKDHWPSMADPQWATSVYEFYEIPPYWQ